MGIVDSTLPITPCILKQLIASLQNTASSYVVRVLMKSMYLLTRHCFLSIGEFTASKDKNCHLLSVQSMCFVKIESNCPIGFELTMESFKHSKGNHILCM